MSCEFCDGNRGLVKLGNERCGSPGCPRNGARACVQCYRYNAKLRNVITFCIECAKERFFGKKSEQKEK